MGRTEYNPWESESEFAQSAKRHDLEPNNVRAILDSGDEIAILHLAENEKTSPEVHYEIYSKYEDLLGSIAMNPNAPLELKFKFPASAFFERDLIPFFKQVNATIDEQIAYAKLTGELVPMEGPLLGEVWKEVRPPM